MYSTLLFKYFLIIVLVILSAFFSASETAYSTVNLIRLKHAKEEGRKGSKKALYLAENFDKTLSTTLIGNNIVNITMASVATILAIEQLNMVREGYGESYGALVSTVLTTVFVLIFGEILPKSIAKEKALSFTLLFASSLLLLMKLFKPISFIIMRFKLLATKLVHKDDEANPSVTEDELEVILNTMHREGILHEDEHEMIQSVLDLSESTVYSIMTPRVDVIGVSINDDLDDIKECFIKEKYTKVPVYKDTKDNIIGILYERDFLMQLLEKGNSLDIQTLIKEPLFVPNTMKVNTLLKVFQNSKQQIAIVSDEHGGTSGIITMEDCLEELVGEIYDEHDEVKLPIKKVGNNTYEVNSTIEIEKLFTELNLGKVPRTQYNTLGGWLYENLEHIPSIGAQFKYTSLLKIDNDITTIEDDQYIEIKIIFTVKELFHRRIKTIRITIEENDN